MLFVKWRGNPPIMIKKISFFLAVLSFGSAFAQSSRCSTDEFLMAKFENNTALKAQYEETIDAIRTASKHVHAMKMAMDDEGDEIITIPVVFHIVHRLSSQNISDERIFEQIDILNADYSGANTDIGSVPSDFSAFVGSSRIRFELASFDPDGNPTTGIERIATDSITFSMNDEGIKHSELGGADVWTNTEYLNIWVGRIENGLLGYATPPNTASASEDGVVIGYKYVGLSSDASYNLGRTATHEIGHYLGLSHIWGPYGPSCSFDDNIADTPMQFDAHYANPGHPSISCNSADMFMNYMDYVEDEDMFFFTIGQVSNMETAVVNYRAGLMNSPALSIEETISVDDIKVHPVPVNSGSELFIQIPEMADVSQIKIIDLLGRVHVSQNVDSDVEEISIKVNGLSTGVYMLQLKGLDNTYNKRIVIR